jgi:hypothetical protein
MDTVSGRPRASLAAIRRSNGTTAHILGATCMMDNPPEIERATLCSNHCTPCGVMISTVPQRGLVVALICTRVAFRVRAGAVSHTRDRPWCVSPSACVQGCYRRRNHRRRTGTGSDASGLASITASARPRSKATASASSARCSALSNAARRCAIRAVSAGGAVSGISGGTDTRSGGDTLLSKPTAMRAGTGIDQPVPVWVAPCSASAARRRRTVATEHPQTRAASLSPTIGGDSIGGGGGDEVGSMPRWWQGVPLEPRGLAGLMRLEGSRGSECAPCTERLANLDILPAVNGWDSNCYATLGGRAC